MLANRCKSLYDTIATILSVLKKLSSKHFYQEYDIQSIPDPGSLEEDLTTFMKDLRLFANNYNISLSFLLVRYGIPNDQYTWIFDTWRLSSNFKALYALLTRLTREITQNDLHRYVGDLDDGFESLNQNVSETGFLILPRFLAINEHIEVDEPTSERDCEKDESAFSWAGDRLHLKFKNIYYIEKKKLTTDSGRQFAIRNHIMESIDGRKLCTTPLIIAASPIVYADVLNTCADTSSRYIATGVEQQTFYVVGTKQKELIHSRIKAAYLAACKENVDILVFPEMLGDATTFEKFFWDELQQQAEKCGLSTPTLVVTPSWWYKQSNQLRVYNDGGEVVLCQQKQYPFTYSTSSEKSKTPVHLMEHLKQPDSTIHILHIPGIGRLMLPICKDFLISGYRDILLRELGATLLLIPSYSFGSTQFNNAMLEAMQYGCYELWLNTCAAFWNDNSKQSKAPDFIGVFASPFPSDNQDRWFCHLKPECKRQCGHANNACIFIINVSLDEYRSVTWRHLTCPVDS